jgi:hypothetical protein
LLNKLKIGFLKMQNLPCGGTGSVVPLFDKIQFHFYGQETFSLLPVLYNLENRKMNHQLTLPCEGTPALQGPFLD